MREVGVLLQFRLRDGIEVVLIVPLAADGGAGELEAGADVRDLDGPEILRALLPAADVPETVVLEGQLHHAFALVARDPGFAVLGELRHLDVRPVAELVDGLVRGHAEGGVLGAAGGVEHGLGIVQVDLAQAEEDPGVAARGLVVGRTSGRR